MNCPLTVQQRLAVLLSPYGLRIESVPINQSIPGSFFGDREAGLIRNTLYLRKDTPIHSALHEAGHFICMPSSRRLALNTDAKGDYAEENAVCYLQILLAQHLTEIGMTAAQMMSDMDSWGYSFRLGNAKDWFEQDAEDACQWLIDHGIITQQQQITFCLRDSIRIN